MTFRQPLNVGSTPHEAPESVWEILVEVSFVPTLSAEQIGQLQDTLWERMEAVVRETLGPFLHEPDMLIVNGVRGRGADTPLFPLLAGASQFTSNLDVVALVEHAAVPDDLRQMAYDACGRAYELDVEVEYRRRPELDGTRRAPMPDPARVARVDRGRARAARSGGKTPRTPA